LGAAVSQQWWNWMQDYNLYGGGGGGQALRMYGNAQSSFSRGNEFYSEPTTPPVSSRASSRKKNGEDSPNEFSPGLLDLHSFDTELLPEVGNLSFSSDSVMRFWMFE
jgi:kinesin family protein 2/24